MTEDMIVKSTPPLRTLYFYLTGDCNMACRHCWIAPTFQNSDRSQKALPFDLFVKAISEAEESGLSGVKLTGGEPLIHPDIISILTCVRDKNFRLTIESNGVAVTPLIAELIASCPGSFISISIDGNRENHEWMRGVKGSFDRVTLGLQTLVSAGIRPQVIMAVADRNKDEIEDLARFAQQMGAGSVKYNFVTPTARGGIMEAEGATVSVPEQIALARWIQDDLQKKLTIPLMTNLPYAFRSLSSMYGPDGNCGRCGIFSILGVLSDGTYALCGIGSHMPELCFGHVAQDRLKDIWESSEVLNRIRVHLPYDLKGVCSRCLVKKLCMGHCIANNYYIEKDLLAGHKFCEDALKAGVFPMTRYIEKN